MVQAGRRAELRELLPRAARCARFEGAADIEDSREARDAEHNAAGRSSWTRLRGRRGYRGRSGMGRRLRVGLPVGRMAGRGARGGAGGDASDARVDAAIERYRKRHRRELLGHFLLTSDYSTGRRFSALERLLYSAAAKDEAVHAGFHAFSARSIGPTDPEFAGLVGRAIRVNLTRGKLRGRNDRPARMSRPAAPGTSRGDPHRRRRAERAGFVSRPCRFCRGCRLRPRQSRLATRLGRPAVARRAVLARARAGYARLRPRRQAGRLHYTVEGYARFLESALEELAVERAHLVLHDFGGPWGLEWAVRNPERLASAVLINTGALLDYRWHYLARIWRTRLAGEAFQATATRSGLRTSLRHGNPRGLPRAFVDRMYDDMDRGTSRAILRLYRSVDDPSAVGRRHADALRRLDRPALVVWGAHDPYIPVAMAARQLKAFPSAEIAILEDSGHWPFADDPEAVGRLVEPFLRGTVSGDRAAVTA